MVHAYTRTQNTHTHVTHKHNFIFLFLYIYFFNYCIYTTASEQHVVGAGFVYRGTVRTSRDACDYI